MADIRKYKVSLRLTKAEYGKLRAAAEHRSMYIAQYVRWLVFKK